MELLSLLRSDFEIFNLVSCEANEKRLHLILNLTSKELSARCPLCQILTKKVHSRYSRILTDLPYGSWEVTLKIRVAKFFCLNSECKRRIFTQRFPEVVVPWARKTIRLIERLQAIGIALGGIAGERLARQIGFDVCGSSLLNYIKKLSLPEFELIKILGVDDFAFRKGKQYGTILVDLETHKPIALLPDRTGETLAQWLTEHQGVEVLSRDRSKAYQSAMTQSCPNSIQVTDRFHLVKNLGETLEKVLNNYQKELKIIEDKQRQTLTSTEKATVTPKPTATAKAQARTQSNHTRRVQQQQQVKKLSEQKWKQEAIAQEVGISVRTVRRFLEQPDFPTTPPRRPTFGRSILEPYKQAILEWWNSGITQAHQLMILLREKGYTGGERTLTRYMSSLRAAQGLRPSRVYHFPDFLPKVRDPQSPPLTPRRATYLILKDPDNHNPEETELLQQLVTIHPDLTRAIDLTNKFLQLIRERKPEAFDAWLRTARNSSLPPFISFAKGLSEDYAAVKASMMLDISNGPVEGLVNRLKTLKRQMYGRAGLDLLSKRFILAK